MSYFDATDLLLKEMCGQVGEIWADCDQADGSTAHAEALIGTLKAEKRWYCGASISVRARAAAAQN